MENNRKKQIVKISILIISIFVIALGVSYAFVRYVSVGTKRQVIKVGTLDVVLDEDENNLTIANALPIADEVALLEEDAFTFRLINNDELDVHYLIKLVEVGNGTLDNSDVRYGLTRDGKTTTGESFDGVIIYNGLVPGKQTTTDFELRLWIDEAVKDETRINGKSLTYKIDVVVGQVPIEGVISDKLFASENLGENCTTYNDGVDTFLVGQCSNNYVWYSGKLWRVVLKNNETGAVKMVTDNAITAISYNKSRGDGNEVFENSYMDQWLNQEFLPTLHNYQYYLVTDYVWDNSMLTSSSSRPSGTTTVERTVGLLNSYEYYTTHNKSGGLATNLTGYLNNGTEWWLMTPSSEDFVKYVASGGRLDSYTTGMYGHSARPSINLKSTIHAYSGTGVLNDPYILEGDVQRIVAGTTLLSTRYSGEYLTFNNELYRIVGVENGLTKVTAVDVPSSLSSNQFHSTDDVTNFAEADIKTDLENYYQGLDTTWKDMIEPNTTWYLSGVDYNTTEYHYKASICANVDANVSIQDCEKTTASTTATIALPRAGEMFTSQITRGTKASFWTLTPDDRKLWFVNSRSTLVSTNYPSKPTDRNGARPSMYLKSNIKIASGNTGNGTYEYPYSIE